MELEHISYHDQLTGLYNRRYFERAMRLLDTPDNLPLSIVICDMNGLKFTNDAFGHETGDRILVITSQVLLEYCRQPDVVARWGGDEFTLLLPRTSHADAATICMQIKENIQMWSCLIR
jgi:diguanylate cyclase (GGDEF)-like protein